MAAPECTCWHTAPGVSRVAVPSCRRDFAATLLSSLTIFLAPFSPNDPTGHQLTAILLTETFWFNLQHSCRGLTWPERFGSLFSSRTAEGICSTKYRHYIPLRSSFYCAA